MRQSSQSGTLALSLRLSESDVNNIEHYLIQQSESSPDKLCLETSENIFDNVLSLVYHYASSRYEKLLKTFSLREDVQIQPK